MESNQVVPLFRRVLNDHTSSLHVTGPPSRNCTCTPEGTTTSTLRVCCFAIGGNWCRRWESNPQAPVPVGEGLTGIPGRIRTFVGEFRRLATASDGGDKSGADYGNRTRHGFVGNDASHLAGIRDLVAATGFAPVASRLSGGCTSACASQQNWSGRMDSNHRLPRSRRGCLAADLRPEIGHAKWNRTTLDQVAAGCLCFSAIA